MLRPALFLDRDGVVNEETNFCHRPEDFHPRKGIFDLVRLARNAGRSVIVVTNQSGIARGLFDEKIYAALTTHMLRLFEQKGAALTDVLHCPYHPEAPLAQYRVDHSWRKPRPGMILEARDRHGLDLAASALIGDRPSDIGAAQAAGLEAACLVGTTLSPEAPRPRRFAVAPDIVAASRWYADLLAKGQGG
ncbi:D-glycero-alpha-D-manno-heptose-1,7-bisphosphate 7-phosphatase [Pontivivens ytuae]|uniref:D,D-heptose 1,7-bisphosphate phosphatase n=1 Tax=Pontivivens ytuae TaxID=2789856 RepID=A0A7S9LQ07_9RHOB|nr:HAD family hydrolase [Pontivivens ytuae]QPH52620.1 HAD family hydrolase [Pontivivens ytuae]